MVSVKERRRARAPIGFWVRLPWKISKLCLFWLHLQHFRGGASKKVSFNRLMVLIKRIHCKKFTIYIVRRRKL